MHTILKKLLTAAAGIIMIAGCTGTVSGDTVIDEQAAASMPVQPPFNGGQLLPGMNNAGTGTYATVAEAGATQTEWHEQQLDSGTIFSAPVTDAGDYEALAVTAAYQLPDSPVTIREAGVFRFTGTLDDGQIIVDAGGEDEVVLILDTVTVTSSSAPIQIENAGKCVIVLPEGSASTLADTSLDAGGNEEEDMAVILSRDDLIITGAGSLRIEASRDNGIQGKDTIVIAGGRITIEATDDGIVGRDSITVIEAELTVTSGGDALKTTNSDPGEEGYLAIQGGSFTLHSGNDAFQAAGSLLIAGGDFSITTQGDRYSDESCKALKAGLDLTVTGGNFLITASDDALHSNSTIHIAGGTFLLDSGDDAVHADDALIIDDGEITIAGCYEGLESERIYINGGRIAVTASDDGLNASDGSGTAGEIRRFPAALGGEAGSTLMVITGGTISINAIGDGLDANGELYMSGGSVTVSGPTTDRESSVDFDRVFLQSGGSIIAAGSSGMLQAPSETVGQSSVLMTYSSSIAAGTTVSLKESSGAVLAAYTPEKPFSAILFSLPALTAGGSYSVETGRSIDVAFTAAADTVWLNESGVTEAAGMGGLGAPMGRGERPDRLGGPPAGRL